MNLKVALLLSKNISPKKALLIYNQMDAEKIFEIASMIRDYYKGNIISYSRKVFIPVTNLCRDICYYCFYRKEPNEEGRYLEIDEIINVAKRGIELGCAEALLMTGERPEGRYKEALVFLNSKGFKSTTEWLCHVSEILLNLGILPHTNAGILSRYEMTKLKESNPSMGLMLENASERLMEKGMPHELAPSKNPKLRIKMIEEAGKLKIPFTTGILVGIGETVEEAIYSIFLIKKLHEEYGHIQEVIIQPFIPKKGTRMENHSPPSEEYFLKLLAISRIILGEMNIQAPPNLFNEVEKLVKAGINDLGGISPLTIDYVNPEKPWPHIEILRKRLAKEGFVLKQRLPVYPEYLNKEGFLSQKVKEVSLKLVDKDGYVNEKII
jgi:7,8-didemethyl-8-hydroxy-5-deazariboflavin synthase CofG subunit